MIVFPAAILVILMAIYSSYSGYYADIEYNYPIWSLQKLKGLYIVFIWGHHYHFDP